MGGASLGEGHIKWGQCTPGRAVWATFHLHSHWNAFSALHCPLWALGRPIPTDHIIRAPLPSEFNFFGVWPMGNNSKKKKEAWRRQMSSYLFPDMLLLWHVSTINYISLDDHSCSMARLQLQVFRGSHYHYPPPCSYKWNWINMGKWYYAKNILGQLVIFMKNTRKLDSYIISHTKINSRLIKNPN